MYEKLASDFTTLTPEWPQVVRRKEKRFVDLAASRGELLEVSIEAVFEPMVQVLPAHGFGCWCLNKWFCNWLR
jgi:hypothetical protein